MVHEFYPSYRATVFLLMCHNPGIISFAQQLQPEYTLIIGVKVDVTEETICRVIFVPNYITLVSKAKCNHRLRIVRDSHIIWDIEHRAEKIKMAKWITDYILPHGDNAP